MSAPVFQVMVSRPLYSYVLWVFTRFSQCICVSVCLCVCVVSDNSVHYQLQHHEGLRTQSIFLWEVPDVSWTFLYLKATCTADQTREIYASWLANTFNANPFSSTFGNIYTSLHVTGHPLKWDHKRKMCRIDQGCIKMWLTPPTWNSSLCALRLLSDKPQRPNLFNWLLLLNKYLVKQVSISRVFFLHLYILSTIIKEENSPHVHVYLLVSLPAGLMCKFTSVLWQLGQDVISLEQDKHG